MCLAHFTPDPVPEKWLVSTGATFSDHPGTTLPPNPVWGFDTLPACVQESIIELHNNNNNNLYSLNNHT